MKIELKKLPEGYRHPTGLTPAHEWAIYENGKPDQTGEKAVLEAFLASAKLETETSPPLHFQAA